MARYHTPDGAWFWICNQAGAGAFHPNQRSCSSTRVSVCLDRVYRRRRASASMPETDVLAGVGSEAPFPYV